MNNTTHIVGTAVLIGTVLMLSTAMAMGKKPQTERPVSSTADTSIKIDSLYRNQQCSVLQEQIRWIDSQQEYQTLYGQLRKSYMSNQAEQPPAVDFTQNGVLLVAMGQKTTGGYTVDLAASEARISGGVLTIQVQWRAPDPGMMVTQALTSPCMLLKVPKAQFDRIELKDQSGIIRQSSIIQPAS